MPRRGRNGLREVCRICYNELWHNKSVKYREEAVLMTVRDFFSRYASDTTAGSSNQLLARFPDSVLRSGRIRYRLFRGGREYALLFSNRVDSTYSDGSVSRAGDCGGAWEILSLRVGTAGAGRGEPSCWHTVTFSGEPRRAVEPGEGFFASDPIRLDAKGGDDLLYEITVRGSCFPYHEEIVLNVCSRTEGEAFAADKRIPVPLMIGSDRPVSLRAGFLGDSITQGCGTEYDSYTHWVARVGEGLPEDVSVWDLGIGFARAYDAARDDLWLERAKTCGIVTVCFGVNDLHHARTPRELTGDLRTIVRGLKGAGCRVILFTVPPFESFEGALRTDWYESNRIIHEELAAEADGIFDFSRAVGRPEPLRHLPLYGGHPDAHGCEILAKAFLEEFGSFYRV